MQLSISKDIDNTKWKYYHESNVQIPEKSMPVHNLDNNMLEKPDTTCPICCTDFPSNSILSPLPCQHYFCLSCLKDYIESKMYAFQVLDIQCPQDGCQEVFQKVHIKSILDGSRFKRYQDLVDKKTMYQNFYNKRLCPKPGCARPISLAQSHNDKEKYITCICETQICVKCWHFWHPEKSCLQANDIEFELYAQNNDIKFCSICKTPVARVEGCLHMTCCVCDYEWCWTCGREFTTDHDCIGFWHPLAPSIYSSTSKKAESMKKFKRKFKRVGAIIFELLIIVILFIPALVLWPLILMSVSIGRRHHPREPRRRLSCKAIISGFFFGLITLPITVLVVTMYAVFIVIKCFFFAIKWFLAKLGIFPNNQQQQQQQYQHQAAKKRWKDGDLSKFAYTNAARPAQNDAVAIDIQPQNVNHTVLQVNDDVSIVAREIEVEGRNIDTSQSVVMELPDYDVSAPLNLSLLLAQENKVTVRRRDNKSMQLLRRYGLEIGPLKRNSRAKSIDIRKNSDDI